MTKDELIDGIRNNRSFDLRSSEYYEPWDVSEETVKEMADDFYYLLKDVLDYLEGEELASEEQKEMDIRQYSDIPTKPIGEDDMEDAALVIANCYGKQWQPAAHGFILGARWQKQKDEKELIFPKVRENKPNNIAEFLNRLTTVEQDFLWEHVEKIKKLEREDIVEKMMREAVDAEIADINYPDGSRLEILAKIPDDKFEDGDKVKLIIKKED